MVWKAAQAIRRHENRAFCLAKLGRFREACQDYDAVLHLVPGNAHASHNRAISMQKLDAPVRHGSPESHPILSQRSTTTTSLEQGEEQQQQQQYQEQGSEQEPPVQWGPEEQQELEQLQLEQREWEEEQQRQHINHRHSKV